MQGKEKCSILKQIRKDIAKANNIPYKTTECKHKGDCLGTCPKCESELKYIESELEKKNNLGKKVALATLCTGIALTMTGCEVPNKQSELSGDVSQPINEITNNVENETHISENSESESENKDIKVIVDSESLSENNIMDGVEITGDVAAP